LDLTTQRLHDVNLGTGAPRELTEEGFGISNADCIQPLLNIRPQSLKVLTNNRGTIRRCAFPIQKVGNCSAELLT
jgi:hypothetical protein